MRIILFILALGLVACDPSKDDAAETKPLHPISVSPISRCMNLGSALEAPREGEWGYTVRQDDLLRIKDAGFDTIRLPVRWSVHTQETAPYAIDPDLVARVDEIVGWAGEIGLNIIVNVHHYDALNEDPDRHEPR
ncbi:MAG: cellulase family glycosylhydrolase, partial [Pseudomonadota bacterium]